MLNRKQLRKINQKLDVTIKHWNYNRLTVLIGDCKIIFSELFVTLSPLFQYKRKRFVVAVVSLVKLFPKVKKPKQ